MGFNRPSKIQETALPMLLNVRPQNLIAQSQSGTGKTAAFVLTMLSRIDTNNDTPQCLCLSPTFEVKISALKIETVFYEDGPLGRSFSSKFCQVCYEDANRKSVCVKEDCV
jgi:hypothetical protein